MFKYIIMDIGLGVKDIIEVEPYPYQNFNKKWVSVKIPDYLPYSHNLIVDREQIIVDKKYLFNSIEEVKEYLENEV